MHRSLADLQHLPVDTTWRTLNTALAPDVFNMSTFSNRLWFIWCFIHKQQFKWIIFTTFKWEVRQQGLLVSKSTGEFVFILSLTADDHICLKYLIYQIFHLVDQFQLFSPCDQHSTQFAVVVDEFLILATTITWDKLWQFGLIFHHCDKTATFTK